MSIEDSLNRIANALERISNPMVSVPVPVAPVVQPGNDAIPDVEDATVNTMGPSLVKTPADLREFAQKHLEKAGDKATDFVKYIRESICAKFSPKEPKLIKILEKDIPKAAQMIYDYAFKNSIIVG
jgi:hypothetical protein